MTALEIGAETELEPNREFRAHGLANLAAALVGGLPAFTLTGPSLSYLRLGASSRLMPILRPLFSLALGVGGLSLLGLVPKVMVGTLLVVFAFGLMDEWLIRARHRLGRSDYILLLYHHRDHRGGRIFARGRSRYSRRCPRLPSQIRQIECH